MVKILVKKLDPHVNLPSYKTIGSSGMDLIAFTGKTITIAPKKSYVVPTGISLAIPENYEIQIRPRSGLAAKNSNCIFSLLLPSHSPSSLLVSAKVSTLPPPPIISTPCFIRYYRASCYIYVNPFQAREKGGGLEAKRPNPVLYSP